jgi:hypothetical protein
MKYCCITNNPLVLNACMSHGDVMFCAGNAETLFDLALHMIESGYVLLIHPLYGNIFPGTSPYRSLLLSAHAYGRDADSLSAMKKAVPYAQNIIKASEPTIWNDEQLHDLQFIDLCLIGEALEKIGAAPL